MSLRLRHLRRHALFAVALAAILVGSLSGADAKTAAGAASDAHSTASGTAALRKVAAGGLTPGEKKYGIPTPRLTDPIEGGGNIQTVYGGPVSPVPVSLAKSKAQLTLPGTTLLGYIRSCIAQPQAGGPDVPELQTCCPGAFAGPTCPSDSFVQHPATSVDDRGLANWAQSDGPVWVKSPRGERKQYGVFPTTTVKLLAFGGVPATAKVHLEQPTGSDGLTEPLQFRQLQLQGPQDEFSNQVPTTVSGFPVPLPLDGRVWLFWQNSTLAGPVDVRVDDLTVDGRHIDVGSSCRTAAPAKLSFSGPRGWAATDTPIAQLYGRPGGFNPLGDNDFRTGTAAALVDVPKFEGCRDGKGLLDPLVTALASGSGNVARISLDEPIRGCESTVGDGQYPCPSYPGDPRLTAGARSANTSSNSGTSLPNKVVERIAGVVRTLPQPLRQSVLTSLSANTRAAVQHVRR